MSTLLTSREAAHLRQLTRARTVSVVAGQIGVASASLLRACALLPARRGTIALIRSFLQIQKG
jgi:hypothetical protein